MKKQLNRTSTSAWCRLGKEGAVLNKEVGLYFHLNQTGVALWELLSEPRDVETLSAVLQKDFDLNEEQAAGDVLRFAEALVTAKLAEWK